MSLLSQWRRDETGATSVEIAISVGAFLLMLLGVLEFAIDMWIWNSMTMAVQQGGRAAMVYYQTPTNQGTNCADAWTNQVQSVVQNYLPGNSANYTLSHNCNIQSLSPVFALMTITASYTMGSISVPGIGGAGRIPGFTLRTQATVPLICTLQPTTNCPTS
ncbi:MAG TPA: TadE/TadG family type IV pilus assembly protein [Stellaceae bacterium]|jgi:Flp pilus assembly protein TadG